MKSAKPQTRKELQKENAELRDDNARLRHVLTTVFRFSVALPGDYEAFVNLKTDRFTVRRTR